MAEEHTQAETVLCVWRQMQDKVQCIKVVNIVYKLVISTWALHTEPQDQDHKEPQLAVMTALAEFAEAIVAVVDRHVLIWHTIQEAVAKQDGQTMVRADVAVQAVAA